MESSGGVDGVKLANDRERPDEIGVHDVGLMREVVLVVVRTPERRLLDIALRDSLESILVCG